MFQSFTAMARLRLHLCLFAVAAGVAPPAVLPPQVRPAASPFIASQTASQAWGTHAGLAGAALPRTDGTARLAPRMQGQPFTVPIEMVYDQEDASLMEALSETQGTDVRFVAGEFDPVASAHSWTASLSAFVLAAAAGVWYGRRRYAKTTELTVPKFAVAACASEAASGPVSAGVWDPLGLCSTG